MFLVSDSSSMQTMHKKCYNPLSNQRRTKSAGREERQQYRKRVDPAFVDAEGRTCLHLEVLQVSAIDMTLPQCLDCLLVVLCALVLSLYTKCEGDICHNYLYYKTVILCLLVGGGPTSPSV